MYCLTFLNLFLVMYVPIREVSFITDHMLPVGVLNAVVPTFCVEVIRCGRLRTVN